MDCGLGRAEEGIDDRRAARPGIQGGLHGRDLLGRGRPSEGGLIRRLGESASVG